jgi:hypothetical protein
VAKLEESGAMTSTKLIAVDKKIWVNDSTFNDSAFAKSNIRLIHPHLSVMQLPEWALLYALFVDSSISCGCQSLNRYI